jgi:hypothetical protein
MRLAVLGLCAAAALASGTAWAVKPDGSLYIKTKDARLLDKPDAKAKVLGTLKPGQEVKWKGSAPENKQFHRVEVAEKAGYTLQQNLSPNRPQLEVLGDDGKPVDLQAYTSSGAATKALSDAALKYAGEVPDALALTRGVLTVEGIAQSVDLKDGEAHVAKQAGGAK